MVNVPYNPNPDTQPSASAPSDYLNVQASPNVFGAQVGQSTERLGSSIEQASNPAFEYAMKRQGQINEAAAVNGETQANDAWGQIQRAYKQNKGFAADDALPAAEEQARQVRQKIRATMPTDAAAKAFDTMVARSEGFVIRDMYNHADTERNAGHAAVLTANRKMWQERSGRPEVAFPGVDGNEDAWNQNMEGIVASASHELNNMVYGSDAGISKVDPETGQPIFSDDQKGKDQKTLYENYINQIKGDAWKQRFQTILKDPDQGSATLAHDLYEKHRDEIPGNVLGEIAGMIAPSYNNQQTREIADTYTGSDGVIWKEQQAQNSQPVSSESLFNAIHDTEFDPKNPDKNPFQIQSATWDTWNSKGWVLPGEQREKSKDNFAVATRAINGYLNDPEIGDGHDMARVITAYKSGVRNVAPKNSDTPWIDPDPIIKGKHYSEWNGGKTVPQVVDAAMRKIQGIPIGGNVQLNKEDYIQLNHEKILQRVYDKAIEKFNGRFDLANQSVVRADQNLRAVLTNEHYLNQNALNTVNQFMTDMDGKGTPMTTSYQFQTASPEIKAAAERVEQQFPTQFKSYQDRMLAQNLSGKATSYGDNFYKNFQDVMNGKTKDIFGLSNDMDGVKLTGTGYNILKGLMDQNNTPEGKSFNNSMSDFYKKVHDVMVQPIPGTVDDKGETRFTEFMQATIPEIQAKQQQKMTAGEMFSPDQKGYVGNTIHLYDRSLPQKMIDFNIARNNAAVRRLIVKNQTPATFDLKSYDKETDPEKGRNALKALFDAKTTTPEQRKQIIQYSESRNWTGKNSGGVPNGGVQ